MKKLFSLLLILTGVTVLLQAETVSSVSAAGGNGVFRVV